MPMSLSPQRSDGSYCIFNGQWFLENQATLPPNNKSYRYGDGFYETIRMYKGQIPLQSYHQHRIIQSLQLLKYATPPHFSMAFLFEQIQELAVQNRCMDNGRIRLSFSNGSGTLFDQQPFQYLIEASPIPVQSNHPTEPLTIGPFQDYKKQSHRYSGLKSASSLIYSLSARYAMEQGWTESILINQRNRVVETTIANLFWIQSAQIFTPPLSAGGVDGVFRRYLLDQFPEIRQANCTLEALKTADEVFLTNGLRGIRAVTHLESQPLSIQRVLLLKSKYQPFP